MSSKRRAMKWSTVFLIQSRHGCALLDQEACYLELPKKRCQGQGSLLLVIPAVNICAPFDKHLCGVELPNMRREMQRSRSIVFEVSIYVSTTICQQPCHV